MEAKAIAKYVRMSYTKLKPVANLVRGKDLEEALTILKFTPGKASELIEKVVTTKAPEVSCGKLYCPLYLENTATFGVMVFETGGQDLALDKIKEALIAFSVILYSESMGSILNSYHDVAMNVKDVCVDYPHGKMKNRVVDNVSLNIYEDEFTVIMGASGSGKTTLLNVMGGMLPAISGTVSWNGNTPVATPDDGSVFIRWDNEIPEGEFNEITLYAVFGKAVAKETDLRGLPAKGFFKQTADITMSTNMTFEGLYNNPRFQGEYDGQGFEIRNLTISGNNDYVALFRQTQGAILRNVILKGGKVTGRTGVAPLVGWQYGGLVERCSANVEVVGTGDHAAGLVGRSSAYATIRESRALGPVKSNRYVGGLVSFTSGTAYTYDCYTLSDVTANSYAGGFISCADNTPVIHNCFAAGRVTSGTPVGGFYGRNDGGRTQIANNYWDKDASGLATSVYGTGLTTAAMQTMSNFGSWSDDVWLKTEGAYPTLRAFAEEDTAERFTVTWENADGTTLAVQEEVRAGRVPQYQGALPVKPTEGATYFYFDGWSPSPAALTSNVTYRATFRESTARTWMTVDLATGAIGYADYDVPTATALFDTLEFKTTKMAFRRVAAGMDYYVQNGAYTAQMTNSYYIGVFEVTVAQFAMMQNGTKPASYVLADLKAQGSRNRNNTRGGTTPAAFGAGITASSSLGLFNARVRTANGDDRLTFDLPTEAMWEVAARAAESGDLVRRTWTWYFGEDESLLADHAFLANDSSPDEWGNTSGLRVPGSRLPNGWGLYDMYGNARELCLDGATGETTPD